MIFNVDDVVNAAQELLPKPARLRETDFKDSWLPRFLNQEDKTIYADWHTHVAGSPYIGVDVFDPNTGDVLFTVPPLITGQLVDVSRDTNQPDAVDETLLAIQKEATHIKLTEQHMLNHVLPRFKVETDPGVLSAWKKVFDHYGLKTNTIVGVQDTHEPTIEDVYEFDDD